MCEKNPGVGFPGRFFFSTRYFERRVKALSNTSNDVKKGKEISSFIYAAEDDSYHVTSARRSGQQFEHQPLLHNNTQQHSSVMFGVHFIFAIVPAVLAAPARPPGDVRRLALYTVFSQCKSWIVF